MTIRKFKARVLPTFQAVQIPENFEGFQEVLTAFVGHLPVAAMEYPIVDGSGGIGLQIYDRRNNGTMNMVTGDWLVLDMESQDLNAYDSTFPTLVDEVQ